MNLKDQLRSYATRSLDYALRRLAWMDPYIQSKVRQPVKYGIIGAALFLGLSLFLPNHYTSTAIIIPADRRSSGLGSLGAAASAATGMGISVPGSEDFDAVYVDILKSRPVREALLNAPYKFSYPGLGRIQFTLGSVSTIRKYEGSLYTFIGASNIDAAVKATENFITITRDLKTKVITIKVETKSPGLSQQLNQNLLKFLNDFILTKSQTKGNAKADFTERRLLEGRIELNKAEEEFRVFMEVNRNYMFSTDPSIKIKGARLENEVKLRTQLLTSLALSREDALLQEKNDMPILNVLDPGNFPARKSGPSRTSNALIFGIVVFLGALAWDFREKIRGLIASSLSDAT